MTPTTLPSADSNGTASSERARAAPAARVARADGLAAFGDRAGDTLAERDADRRAALVDARRQLLASGVDDEQARALAVEQRRDAPDDRFQQIVEQQAAGERVGDVAHARELPLGL